MAEDSDLEKTEEPSLQRREDARRDGQLPQSKELSTALALFGAAVVLHVAGPAFGRRAFALFSNGIIGLNGSQFDSGQVMLHVQLMGWQMLAMLTPILLAFAGTALAIGAAQGRGNLTGKPLVPRWDKLDPVKNAKRLFGRQPWIELVRSAVKLTVIALALRWALLSAWPEILALVQQPPSAAILIAHRYAVRLLATAGTAYIALGLLDYGYQIWDNEQKLRMTREDLRQEMKRGEVDPLIRQRMRSAARERGRRQMFEQVPTADVVITNPVHIAVALKYDQSRDAAPVIVAMGQELIAQRIREIAAEHNVPIIENKPVARALFASARVGSEIPPDLYTAIIEVYAFVIRQRAAARGGRWDA
jgi:flagellar biosynthesis protein FlhB